MKKIKSAIVCGSAADTAMVMDALRASGCSAVCISPDGGNQNRVAIISPNGEYAFDIYKSIYGISDGVADASLSDAFIAASDSPDASAVNAASSWLDARSADGGESLLVVFGDPQNFTASLSKRLTESARSYLRERVTVAQAVCDRLVVAPARTLSGDAGAPVYAEACRPVYLSDESAARAFGEAGSFVYDGNTAYRAACARCISGFALDAAAYLGALKGMDTIAGALADGETADVVETALDDIACAVAAEYDADENEIRAYAHDTVKRLAVFAQHDSVRRAAADSETHLAADKPLASALKLCGKHGAPSEAVCTAVAAAFRYTADAPSALVESYVKINGIPLGLFRYSGITDTALCDAVRIRFDALAKAK